MYNYVSHKIYIKLHENLNDSVLGVAILSTHAIAYTNFAKSSYVGFNSWSGL